MTDSVVTDLVAVLRKHFPNATEAEIGQHAGEIHNTWEVAAALERIERADKSGEHDRERLDKAGRHLRRAAALIRSTGWHAGEAFRSTSDAGPQKSRLASNLGRTEASAFVADEIASIAEIVEQSGASVKDDAPHTFKYLREDKKLGAPVKTAALNVARACADSFERLTGKKATRQTSPYDGRGYGHFFELVSEVFGALKMDADPSSMIRSALGHKRGKDST